MLWVKEGSELSSFDPSLFLPMQSVLFTCVTMGFKNAKSDSSFPSMLIMHGVSIGDKGCAWFEGY